MYRFIGRVAALTAACTLVLGVGPAAAHEEREIGDITMVVGFLDEPVYVGQKSGLDLRVSRAGEPVEALEETIEAEVIFDGETRALELSPAFGDPGAYRSVFIPTAAGPYTFRLSGEIDGEPIDESFTAGPETFGEVQDTAANQFPVVLPADADVARDAEAGAGAATTATLALALGAGGLVVGVVALALALARRRG
jgi:hypothetical protein